MDERKDEPSPVINFQLGKVMRITPLMQEQIDDMQRAEIRHRQAEAARKEAEEKESLLFWLVLPAIITLAAFMVVCLFVGLHVVLWRIAEWIA